MTMCKAILTFILLLTGYLCNNTDVAASTTPSDNVSPSVSDTSKVTKAPEWETAYESDHDLAEEFLSVPVVAGIIISVVFLCILLIIAVWYAWKKKKGSSVETTSVPSGEPGVSLRIISARTN